MRADERLKHQVTTQIFPVEDLNTCKEKVLNWLQRFNTFSFLDNHLYSSPSSGIELLVGAGVRQAIELNDGRRDDGFTQLQQFIDRHRGQWIFGHFNYEFGAARLNAIETEKSLIGFPAMSLYTAETVIRIISGTLEITASNPAGILEQILNATSTANNSSFAPVNVQGRFSKERYVHTIGQLRQHILRGDCYEINFCQEFFAEGVQTDPFEIYKRLTTVSPNPFASLYRLGEKWLMCASPERFMKREGDRILSQPIKGTIKRNTTDQQADDLLREGLYASEKDRSENVMVVDLVRNDLSRICREGTVQVDELFGIYTFPQVHQMISSISGQLRENITFSEILQAMFPMGSMTGAPKQRVTELIARYELRERGLFSGSTGYIAPNGDFDFNVVIRSILYNSSTGYVSMPAGSGITFYSNAQDEWNECLLKAEAMTRAFGKSTL